MEERNLVVVLLLSFATFGIYTLYWFYKTGKELRQRGKEIPNFILLFIPFVNLYYAYKYWKAAESITDLSILLQAVVFLFIGPAYPAVIQYKYNELADSSTQTEQEGGLLPLDDVEKDEFSEGQEDEENFSLDGLDEEMEDMDMDEDLDLDEAMNVSVDEEDEPVESEENDKSHEEVEEVVEEVDELLKEGKKQQDITIKLRGEGRSDTLISQAYHIENERNNYE